jgi:sulfoxide reductase heme-binding subunit YedZ
MMRAMNRRLILWLVLALPGVGIAVQYATDAISYGQVIHLTGDMSVEFLIVTLAVTPLRLAFPRAPLPLWMLKRRREFGLASFGYAAFHLVTYLWRKADLALITKEGKEWDLATGWIAFALFVALAVTSNDASMRLLRRGWKLLHRLVYPAAVLALAHWLLTAFEPRDAIIHACVLAAVEAARLALMAVRRRRTISA